MLIQSVLKATGKPNPVLLVGSGWQDVNIGDIAHTLGFTTLLKKRLPNAKIILWKRSKSQLCEGGSGTSAGWNWPLKTIGLRTYGGDYRGTQTLGTGTALMGVEIIRSPTGTFTYKPVGVEKRILKLKMYLCPIPQGEMNASKRLIRTLAGSVCDGL